MGQPTAEGWERIEKALGITLAQARRDDLSFMLDQISKQPWDEAAKIDAANPFSGYNLRWLDEHPEFINNYYYKRQYSTLKLQAQKTRDVLDAANWRAPKLDEIIAQLDAIAPEPMTLLREKGGRPIDWKLRTMFYTLDSYYEKLTGRWPTVSHSEPYGPFFIFVKECLLAFAPTLQSDGTLAQAIRLHLDKQEEVVSGTLTRRECRRLGGI